MYQKRVLNIRVQCPAEPLRVEKMQITFRFMEDGGWLNLPCNGCESMNGTKPCEQCCNAINDLFFHHPETDASTIIRLRLDL